MHRLLLPYCRFYSKTKSLKRQAYEIHFMSSTHTLYILTCKRTVYMNMWLVYVGVLNAKVEVFRQSVHPYSVNLKYTQNTKVLDVSWQYIIYQNDCYPWLSFYANDLSLSCLIKAYLCILLLFIFKFDFQPVIWDYLVYSIGAWHNSSTL